MSLENYFIFSFDFITKDGIKGHLAKDCDDDIIIDIAGFSSLIFCNAEEFEYITKIDVDTIAPGDIIKLDDVSVTITDMDTETHAENLRFWDRVESMEMNGWND